MCRFPEGGKGWGEAGGGLKGGKEDTEEEKALSVHDVRAGKWVARSGVLLC